MGGIDGISGVSAFTPTTSVSNARSDGAIEISFGSGTNAQSTDSGDIYNYLNYVANRIAELKKESNLSSSERCELAELERKLAQQKEVCDFSVSADGKTVTFRIKKDINVEAFKDLFYIDAGAFRNELKSEALADGNEVIGVEKNDAGETIPIYSGSYRDWFDAELVGVMSFSNGVVLERTPDGKIYPNYTGATLRAGWSYDVGQSYIDPPNRSFWDSWW